MSADLMRFEIQFQGKSVDVVLENLPWKELVGIAVDPNTMKPDDRAFYGAASLRRSLATIDGIAGTRKRREALEAEPEAVEVILARRDEVFTQLRGAGRMYAQCPHCHAGEVEMSLLGLFNTLGVLPSPMISDDRAFFLPPISHLWSGPLARPAHFSYASRIRFALPTHLAGLPRTGFEGGVLGRASADRTRPLYERWENDGVNAPLEQTWRSRDRATFQATITLLAAIRELVPSEEPTIEAFEELPAVDVYFLDVLYHLAFDTDVPDHAMPRECPACAQSLLPVAPLVWEAPLP